MAKVKNYVYVVTSLPCDCDGASKGIVKIFSDEEKADIFRDKMELKDKKDQKKYMCDPTEYEVEKWEVE
jgi:hypothetical protein